jgi:AAA domain
MTVSISDVVSGPSTRSPRIIVLGQEKIGKSTFSAEAPSPVFIPIIGEEGIDSLGVERFPVAEDLEGLLGILRVLAREDHDFKTVVVDSVSALEPLIWEHLCQDRGWKSIEAPGYGKGYVEALSYWRKLTRALDYLRTERGMSSILIGHVRVKTVSDPRVEPFDAFVADIHDKAAMLIYRWADSILFANRKLMTSKSSGSFGKTNMRALGTDERLLCTQGRPFHPGGGRGVYGQLPYELPLSWAAFEKAIHSTSNQEDDQ